MIAVGWEIKNMFFDRNAVLHAMTATTRTVLSEFGKRVRQTSRASMRKRQGRSKPGQPPSVHKGYLKNLLFYAWDQNTTSVVVGPIAFGKIPGAGVLEHGGQTMLANNHTRRVVGSGGEVRLGGKSSKTTKTVIDWRGKRVKVTYAHLSTGRQAANANRLQLLLYGPKERVINVEPRPFMLPALTTDLPLLPNLWKNSLIAAA